MLTGIDHLVVAVDDPDVAAAELERAVGLAAGPGGRHPGLGTRNRLVWLGDTYLELIGVDDRGLAAGSWIGPPTLAALAAGGGLATYALASDDLATDLDRLRAGGARWTGPSSGERTRPDGRVVRWSLGLPARLGPAEAPFLIEHDRTAAEWTDEERRDRAAARHPLGAPVRLEVLELPVTSARLVQDTYVRALGLLFRPSLAGRGARDTSVDRQIVRIRPVRAPEPPTVRLVAAVTGGRDVTVLGLRFVVRSAAVPRGASATG